MEEQVRVMMAHAATRNRSRVRGWFYISAALFTILLSIAGFGPSIIDQSRRNAPPTPMVIAHGIVAGAWFLLFLVQATLVATRRVAVHRRLGMIGPVLAVVLIVLGVQTTIETTRRGYDPSGDVTRTFVTPGSPPLTAAERAAGDLGAWRRSRRPALADNVEFHQTPQQTRTHTNDYADKDVPTY
jgi:hypothetical protein